MQVVHFPAVVEKLLRRGEKIDCGASQQDFPLPRQGFSITLRLFFPVCTSFWSCENGPRLQGLSIGLASSGVAEQSPEGRCLRG